MLTLEEVRSFKLGKGPALVDRLFRTIPYAKIRLPYRTLPPPPLTYDAQAEFNVIDLAMLLNNIYGNCVLASGYHLLMVLEKWEAGLTLTPTEQEIKDTYFKLTGGSDTGLVILDFLNYFRQTGIPINGQFFKIHAFVSVAWKNHAEVMDVLFYLKNIILGIALPITAQSQISTGKSWTVVGDGKTGDSAPGTWGLHGVYGFAYIKLVDVNEVGPVVETWGQRQQMTWAWFDIYVDECYSVIAEKNMPNSSIDTVLLEAELGAILQNPIPPDQPPVPAPLVITTTLLPNGIVGQAYSQTLIAVGGVPPYSWTIPNGPLVVGLILGINGILAGYPSLAAENHFTVYATDSTGMIATMPLAIIIDPAPVPPPVRSGCLIIARPAALLLGYKRKKEIKMSEQKNKTSVLQIPLPTVPSWLNWAFVSKVLAIAIAIGTYTITNSLWPAEKVLITFIVAALGIIVTEVPTQVKIAAAQIKIKAYETKLAAYETKLAAMETRLPAPPKP